MVVTMSMEELPVVVTISPASGFRDSVINFQFVLRLNVHSTVSTFPVLPFQKCCHSSWCTRMLASSFCPVNPIAVVGTFAFAYFDVPFDGRFRMSVKGFPVFGCKVPRVLFPSPVFVVNPAPGFVGMTTSRPAFDFDESKVYQFAKHFLR